MRLQTQGGDYVILEEDGSATLTTRLGKVIAQATFLTVDALYRWLEWKS